MNLERKSVLLTGAGSGIGRATAVLLAAKRARLTLLGRRLAPLEETAGLVRQGGGETEIVVGDIADGATRQRAIAAAVVRFGGIDLLVNNAGNVRAGRLERISEDDIAAMIEINLHAPILLTRDALPALRKSGDAAIVLVSSGIGLVGMPFYSAYAAVKAGIAHFGEALRRELAGEGIHVMTVFPAATDTPMMASSKAGADLGVVLEPPEAVAAALVAGLEAGEREVIRGGDARRALIAANRERPWEVDERFRVSKAKFEAAVRGHRAM